MENILPPWPAVAAVPGFDKFAEAVWKPRLTICDAIPNLFLRNFFRWKLKSIESVANG